MAKNHYPLIIIGAGAAGIGASHQATALGIEHLVVEASHRAGGRGLTEQLDNGVAVDLGCHWMHSASINPMPALADRFKLTYSTESYQADIKNTNPASKATSSEELEQYLQNCYDAMEAAFKRGEDKSIMDVVDTESHWFGYFNHWMSLMTSKDCDQVSLGDLCRYKDTGEDWPLREGYGTLLARCAETCPILLNCQISSIDYTKSPCKLASNQGTLSADRIIITVSNGVLSSGDIQFIPRLPLSKQDSIAKLSLGHYNNLIFALKRDLGDAEVERRKILMDNDNYLNIKTRPFADNYVFTAVGGRFAEWLEKQGGDAMQAYFREALINVYGHDFDKELGQFKYSAWNQDPLVRGAYSASSPGHSYLREHMAESVADCLFFAGEACSKDAFATAHGAYTSGIDAVKQSRQRTFDDTLQQP